MENRQHKTSRRKFLWWTLGAVAATAVPTVIIRSTGYPEITGWNGKVLSARQAHILMSASGVILPDHLQPDDHRKVAENVDRFIFTLPQEITSQIGLLFGVVENITFMDLQYRRFTRLDPAGKIGYLERLNSIGSELRTVYNALREFCMLGYYQQESSWEKMGYAGPMVDGSVRERHIRYSSLVAPPGKLPKSIATI